MKRIVALSLAMLLLSTLLGCEKDTPMASTLSGHGGSGASDATAKLPLPTRAAPINTIGNTSGNMSNDGKVASQGEWIYYNGNDGLCKIKTNGKENQMLLARSDCGANSFEAVNVVGDWIYYSCEISNLYEGSSGEITKSIYRVKTDGTALQCLDSDFGAANMFVVDDWIYFQLSDFPSVDSDLGGIYKMRTDGSERQQLTDSNHAGLLFVQDHEIFFDTGIGIGKVDINGDNMEMLIGLAKGDAAFDDPEADWEKLAEAVFYVSVSGDRIYYFYSGFNYEHGIYSIKTDGSDKRLLTEDQAQHLNVADGWVYYENVTDDGARSCLYRISIDGNDKQKLTEDSVWNVSVLGEWLWVGANSWHEVMKTDGSERRPIPREFDK